VRRGAGSGSPAGTRLPPEALSSSAHRSGLTAWHRRDGAERRWAVQRVRAPGAVFSATRAAEHRAEPARAALGREAFGAAPKSAGDGGTGAVVRRLVGRKSVPSRVLPGSLRGLGTSLGLSRSARRKILPARLLRLISPLG